MKMVHWHDSNLNFFYFKNTNSKRYLPELLNFDIPTTKVVWSLFTYIPDLIGYAVWPDPPEQVKMKCASSKIIK